MVSFIYTFIFELTTDSLLASSEWGSG